VLVVSTQPELWLLAPASQFLLFRLQRAAREVAVDIAVGSRSRLLFRRPEDLVMAWRQAAGGVGVGGAAGQREGLAAAAAGFLLNNDLLIVIGALGVLITALIGKLENVFLGWKKL